MSKFTQALENMSANISVTENGAIGYQTTGEYLVDMNFQTSSMRSMDDKRIITLFERSYDQEPGLTLKWLFYLRDIRGGMGERRSFRIIARHMANNHTEVMYKYIASIPEYGRWDDLFIFRDTNLDAAVGQILRSQLLNDLENLNKGNVSDISLLAKWMPNINSKSAARKSLAQWLKTKCGINSSEAYRKYKSLLNAAIDTVEVKMSADRFDEIKYPGVPSRAAMIYRDAFDRHDGERYEAYIEDVKNGKATINAGTLFPHDLVSQYRNSGYLMDKDEVIEELWKALPPIEIDNTLVVTDVSGSMHTIISNSSRVEAIDVSLALTLYIGQQLPDPFHNKSIIFSSKPHFLEFDFDSLYEKLDYFNDYNDCSNTDIARTFQLILDAAIDNKLTQEDLPVNLLIISDMEFDYISGRNDKRLFDVISERFTNAGYKMPRLIFWNVCGRTSTIPVIENENGVVLISGFSPSTLKMVTSGRLNPFDALCDILESDRYSHITIDN